MAVKKKPKKRGGARKGAGRKKGGRNRFSQEALEAAKITGELPLDYMLRVMRDARAQKPRRDGMAIAAAPYLHQKLSSVELKTKKGQPLELVTRNMTPKEAAAAYASTLTLDETE